MMMKSYVPYGILMLVLGSAVAALPLQSNFSLLDKYQIEAEVVYVYLKTFEVNENASGLWRVNMVSYVVVLNVTNPTDKTIRMRDIDIGLAGAGSVTKKDNGITAINSILRTYRYFPQGSFDYFWQPHSSILVVFSGMREINPDFLQTDLDSYLEIRGRTAEDAYATSDWIVKSLEMKAIGESEYVYNIMLGTPRFHYTDDGVGVSFEG